MAHFGNEELVDSIRHGLAIEDDTGLSTKILGKEIRRCKPGGLPLNFAAQSDSSEDEQSSVFEFPPLDSIPTSQLCQQNILKKAKDVKNLIQARRNQKPILDQEQIDHYFIKHEVSSSPSKPTTSLLSHLIEERQNDKLTEKFSEFGKFEAFENEPTSKLIQILFPFSDHAPNSPPKVIPVRAKNNATMEEFIGLCCFLYTRAGFTPKCLETYRYSLYMADDSCEFDTELPPIDRNRFVGDCGFPILAMVENKDDQAFKAKKYIVSVYLVSGHKFLFELDNLNDNLEWLRDEALKRRQEVVGIQRANMRQPIYELQSIENDQSLKLSNTISSSGLLEFLLIRQNSSRANFNPLTINDSNEAGGPRAPLFVQTRQRPADLRQLAPLSSSPQLSKNIDSPTISVRSAFTSFPAPGNLIQEYFVERIHRLKARCSSKIAIRDDCLEITPIQLEKRRAFVPQSTQKYTTIVWDLIGGVDCSERHNARRITKICWLPVSSEVYELQDRYQKHLNRTRQRVNDNFYQDAPPQQIIDSHRLSSSHSTNPETDTSSSSPSKTTYSARPSLNEGPFNGSNNNQPSDFDPTPLLKAYDDLSWKIISVETNNDDSWQISIKINEIIDAKNSIIRQIFQNSIGGTRRPRAAAEETFNSKNTSNYSPNETKRQSLAPSNSIGNLKAYKKRKSINPVPLLNRMLSRQD